MIHSHTSHIQLKLFTIATAIHGRLSDILKTNGKLQTTTQKIAKILQGSGQTTNDKRQTTNDERRTKTADDDADDDKDDSYGPTTTANFSASTA